MSATAVCRYFVGLDVGQGQECTALAVLACTQDPKADEHAPTVRRYAVRHLERFAPGAAYTDVATRLAGLFAEPPLAGQTLVVDQTAVGRPVLDLLRLSRVGAKVTAVTVTAGHQACSDERGGWLVPKKELVSTLQVLLQARRLQVAPSLPEAETLVLELLNFRLKPLPAHAASDPLAAWRDGAHDDLVLAVAIATWKSERRREFWFC